MLSPVPTARLNVFVVSDHDNIRWFHPDFRTASQISHSQGIICDVRRQIIDEDISFSEASTRSIR